MNKEFCEKLGNPFYCNEDNGEPVKTRTFWEEEPDEENVAVKTRTFWEDKDKEDNEFECFCKPIRTPLQNGFFGSDGYNTHPLQKYDR